MPKEGARRRLLPKGATVQQMQDFIEAYTLGPTVWELSVNLLPPTQMRSLQTHVRGVTKGLLSLPADYRNEWWNSDGHPYVPTVPTLEQILLPNTLRQLYNMSISTSDKMQCAAHSLLRAPLTPATRDVHAVRITLQAAQWYPAELPTLQPLPTEQLPNSNEQWYIATDASLATHTIGICVGTRYKIIWSICVSYKNFHGLTVYDLEWEAALSSGTHITSEST